MNRQGDAGGEMKDLRRQIPLCSFLNGVIVPRIDPLDDVRRECSDVMRLLDRPSFEYSLMNAANIAGMLYCLLVVPRELFDGPQDTAVFAAVRDEGLSRRFQVVRSDARYDADPEGQLLRRLRNAVSHANFAIWDDDLFDFWDQRPGAQSREWEARISRVDLLLVLSKLGHHFGQAEF